MDVNRDNFFSVLPEILQDIKDADYVAIDGEFTGILPLRQRNFFDTPTERYARHYECDRHYLMIQFGLAMIRCISPRENRYALKAYNFYLYSENEMDAIDFRSKSSSLQFLARNHFDFNQLFLKGIPFISQTSYFDKLKQQSQQPADGRVTNQQMPMPNGNKRGPGESVNNVMADGLQQNPSDANRRMVGFSRVIWALQESGKPIIGHNLYTDIIHLINQFFVPIPASYAEYKAILKTLFPKIIDTKLLASTSIFQSVMSNTALNAVYKTVREKHFPNCHFDVPANFSYALGDYEHTAGYDATCTAICMAKMMAYIAGQTNFKENPIQHPLINSFIGKFFFMGSFDLRYADMISDDDFPDRSGVFYVKRPPPSSSLNIREYFKQWGYPFIETYDSTTDIVALSLRNETTDTLLTKMRAGNPTLQIVSYAQFHQLDLSKMKIRQPNHLFDIDSSKRNSNKGTEADAEGAIPSSPMDITTPMLDSTSSSPANPLHVAIGQNTTSSTTSPSLNERRRPKM